MSKGKKFFLTASILVISLFTAWFIVANNQPVLIDVLIEPMPVEVSLGSLILVAFGSGIFLGCLCCMWYAIMRNVELKNARRELDSVSKKLEEVHSLTR